MIYKGSSTGLTDTFGNGVGGRRPLVLLIIMTSSSMHSVGFLGGTHFDTNVGTTNATQYSIHMRSYQALSMLIEVNSFKMVI